MKNLSAQSAMEYLMTYGWAILIISIVLAALFALGVFSSSSFIGSSCIAASGYECSAPLLLHNGYFTSIVGQATGNSWTAANIIFVVSGSSVPTNPIPSPTLSCVEAPAGGILANGGSFTTAYNGAYYNGACYGFGTPQVPGGITIGSTIVGSLWASYSIGSASGLFSQIATVTLKTT